MQSLYRRQLRHIVTALALLWLAACTAPVIVQPKIPPPASTTAAVPVLRPSTRQVQPVTGNKLSTSGITQQRSVSELLQRAATAAAPRQQQLQLKAVGLLLQNQQQKQAARLLARIDTSRTTTVLRAQKQLFVAEIALGTKRLRRATNLLGSITTLRGLPPELLGRAYLLQSQLHIAQGAILAAAIDLIHRSTTLSDPAQTRNNEQQIWQLLSSVTVSELQQAREQEKSSLVAGWLDLSLAQLNALAQSRSPVTALRDWQARYPNHPAARQLLFDLAPTLAQRANNLQPPRKIALLLPLSSRYARPAKIIQESILDANQAQFVSATPQITVYDIGDDPTLAGLYYRQAIQQGADWVIGPLGKEAARDLVTSTELSIPTLLLAVLPATVPTTYNTFQIGLPPEQEAQRLAERAARDHLRKAVAFYPNTARGKRLVQAWQQQWQQLGGKIAGVAAYDPKISDQSRILKKYLGIYASELRMRRLQTALRSRLKFQPRRRQDIDHIVLFADAASGRLIKPQLNFYQAIDLPVYSTSDIYSGQPDKIRDTDLNGIHFTDMPWVLNQQGISAATRSQLLQSNPLSADRRSRLYALGIDAYRILSHLGYLRDRPDSVYVGVSATMRMDATRRLQRYPLWAVFVNGLAVVDPAKNILGISTATSADNGQPQPGASIHEIDIGKNNDYNPNRPAGGTDRWQPPAVPGVTDSPSQLPIPGG
ncbi:MAG TPA: hypothetical protein ENI62_01470 [Gammaproteobacteria bacterium]|nr:hypothetical protein [Gammaproteobacteria bacterium]